MFWDQKGEKERVSKEIAGPAERVDIEHMNVLTKEAGEIRVGDRQARAKVDGKATLVKVVKDNPRKEEERVRARVPTKTPTPTHTTTRSQKEKASKVRGTSGAEKARSITWIWKAEKAKDHGPKMIPENFGLPSTSADSR